MTPGLTRLFAKMGRRLAPDSIFTSFEVHVQLKATFQEPVEQDGRYSYSLTVPRYKKLRNPRVNSPRLLIVLYLPRDATQWLHHSEDGLLAKALRRTG